MNCGSAVPRNVAFSDGAASDTVPMRASTDVDAVIVADISELRSVCTPSTSEPFCADSATNHCSRKVTCAARASVCGCRRPATARRTWYASRTTTVIAASHQPSGSAMAVR